MLKFNNVSGEMRTKADQFIVFSKLTSLNTTRVHGTTSNEYTDNPFRTKRISFI